MGINSKQSSNKSFPAHHSPIIALIGCGAIAEHYYLPALSRHSSVMDKLVLVDSDKERVQQVASKFQVNSWQDDHRRVLDEADGVIIAVPTHLHYPIAIEFLSKGVPVLCEKPLAEDTTRAREIVKVASQNGSILAVNYLQRFIPTFAKVKEWLLEYKFGDLRYLKYHVGEEFDWPSITGFYFNSPISARGVLRDRGAHVLDHICWWLGGKPKLVSSQNDSFGGSEALAYIQFEFGQCTGEVKLSWLEAFPSTYGIVCENATILGDVYDYQNIAVEHRGGHRQQLNLKTQEKSKLDIANKIVNNFIDVIIKGERPLVSGSDVLESIEFIDECYQAATRFKMPWYEIPEVQNAW